MDHVDKKKKPKCPKDFHALYGMKYDHEKEKVLYAFDFEFQLDYLLGSDLFEEERGFVESTQNYFQEFSRLPTKLADQLRYLFEREFDKDAGVPVFGLS